MHIARQQLVAAAPSTGAVRLSHRFFYLELSKTLISYGVIETRESFVRAPPKFCPLLSTSYFEVLRTKQRPQREEVCVLIPVSKLLLSLFFPSAVHEAGGIPGHVQ